jgi:hypothetical protein
VYLSIIALRVRDREQERKIFLSETSIVVRGFVTDGLSLSLARSLERSIKITSRRSTFRRHQSFLV